LPLSESSGLALNAWALEFGQFIAVVELHATAELEGEHQAVAADLP